jgi:hypothetical protein
MPLEAWIYASGYGHVDVTKPGIQRQHHAHMRAGSNWNLEMTFRNMRDQLAACMYAASMAAAAAARAGLMRFTCTTGEAWCGLCNVADAATHHGDRLVCVLVS